MICEVPTCSYFPALPASHCKYHRLSPFLLKYQLVLKRQIRQQSQIKSDSHLATCLTQLWPLRRVEKRARKQFISCHFACSGPHFIPQTTSHYFHALYIPTDTVRANNHRKGSVPTVTQQVIECVFPISPTLANPSGDSVSANTLCCIWETYPLVLEITPIHNKQRWQIVD